MIASSVKPWRDLLGEADSRRDGPSPRPRARSAPVRSSVKAVTMSRALRFMDQLLSPYHRRLLRRERDPAVGEKGIGIRHGGRIPRRNVSSDGVGPQEAISMPRKWHEN